MSGQCSMKRGKYFIPQLVITMWYGQLGYEKTSIHFIINLANAPLPYRYEVKKVFSFECWSKKKKIKFFSKKLYKSSFGGQCYAKRRKSTDTC